MIIRNLFSIVLMSTILQGSRCPASDEIPGAPQRKPIALVNATIHPVAGPPIEGGTIVFANGQITGVGRKIKPPKRAEIIDLEGLNIYPGLIEAHSQIGLKEISAVRATVDTSETGSINPNVKANISFNPDSEVIPVTRANGVLIAVSAPGRARISGMAAVMQLDGWTYEDMTLKADAAMFVNWPSPSASGNSSGLKQLRQVFDDARAYRAARAVNAELPTQLFDIRLDAIIPVLERKIPVMARANSVQAIQAAVSFAVEQDVRLIIFGGHDAELCADLLKQYNVPVIVDSIHRRPARRHESYDTAYTLPQRLKQAGIRFCISGSDRAETWNARNLPYQAATAVAHGLSHDDALKSVTLYAARILGIDDRVGSLEVGKDATLIVTNGDPLETDTHVTMAFVQGRKVQLTSRHTRLYEKYSEKYRQQRQTSR